MHVESKVCKATAQEISRLTLPEAGGNGLSLIPQVAFTSYGSAWVSSSTKSLPDARDSLLKVIWITVC